MSAPAGVGRRVAGFAIDVAIFFFLLSAIVGIAYPDVAHEGHQTTDAENTGIGLITLGVLTLAFNYFALAEWRWGKTIGKRAVGVRVIAEPGAELTWNRAVIRNLARVVDALGGFLLMTGDDRHQRVGDRLGRSVVVRDLGAATAYAAPMPSTQPPPPPPVPGLSQAPPPTPPPPERPGWGPARTLAALGVFLVALVIEASVVAAFDPDLDSLGAKLALQGLLALTLVAVAFGGAWPGRGIAPAATLGLRRPTGPVLRPAVAGYLVYIGCALVLNALIHPEQDDVTRELGFDESAFGAIAAGVLIIIAAPLSEEIFFRGFMFSGIRRGAPFAVAAISSATVWGLFHYTGPDSWGVCLQLAIFGVVLAWLYQRTGSIWPTIAVHMFNNALAFAILAS
jgi:membrane protease YdiL (CAAX protease family)/uncharacterized RDD family membrane protein YckC